MFMDTRTLCLMKPLGDGKDEMSRKVGRGMQRKEETEETSVM